MIATFFHNGYVRAPYPKEMYYHEYTVLCANGVLFDTFEYEYLKDGSKYVISDDMCAPDSGDVVWECGNCRQVYETRTRPGGAVKCPVCSNEEKCPEDAVLLEGRPRLMVPEED